MAASSGKSLEISMDGPPEGIAPRRPRIFGEACIATASPMIKPLARAVIAALHRRVSIQIRLIWAN